METLVIKGHPTRGKEVINILKMLGGNNIKEHYGESNLIYTIRKGDNVIVGRYPNSNISQIYTLEEFLEKFPFKVGDKVRNARINDFVGKITNARWDDNEEQIIYVVEWDDVTKSTLTYFARDLQPYKEVMEEKKLNSNASFLDCSMVEKIELALGDTHEVVVENGKTFIVRKKPQYPKTYEKCCKIMKIHSSYELFGYATTQGEVTNCAYSQNLLKKINKFQQLIICRDAYWKIAGDWKPDWENTEQDKYVIEYIKGEVVTHGYQWNETNHFLSFPTDEMRDAFYENFKELIEQCKELL